MKPKGKVPLVPKVTPKKARFPAPDFEPVEIDDFSDEDDDEDEFDDEDEEDDNEFDEKDDDFDEFDEDIDEEDDDFSEEEEEEEGTTVTFSMVFHNVNEEKRKELPTDGFWQYLDDRLKWNFTQALYTYDTKLKESCGTKYDRDDQTSALLRDIYRFDRARALDDWDFLLRTFPAQVLDEAGNFISEPPSFLLSVRTFSFLFDRREDCNELAAFISRDDVFDYLIRQARWVEHKTLYLEELLLCSHASKDEEFMMKCYRTVLAAQQNCFCDKDLAEVWDYVLYKIEWEEFGGETRREIKEELLRIGDFAKPALKKIAEQEEEIEERRREELEEAERRRQELEEKERERQELEEAERRRQEQADAEAEERRQTIKTIEELAATLTQKIKDGELFDETYRQVDKTFAYCFGAGQKTFETVARYLLGRKGAITDVSLDLQSGVISSKEIKTIYLLTATGGDIAARHRVPYGGKAALQSEEKRREINQPIVEYICQYCYPVRLMRLEAHANSLGVRLSHSPVLSEANRVYMSCLERIREEAQAIFRGITDGGVKVSWIEEKKLFTCAALRYPDARYKVTPPWAGQLCFDIYIPILNAVIEYRQSLPDGASPIAQERYRAERKKFESKRALCLSRGIAFLAWDDKTAINEATFAAFMKPLEEKNS